MTRLLLLITLITSTMATSFSAYAERPRFTTERPNQAIIGISTYLGHMQNEHGTTGQYVGGSMYMYFFNWSIEAQNFPRTNIIKPYVGLGLGRFLQLQRSVNYEGRVSFRVMSEIAFDEWIDKRNHWTLHMSAEQLDIFGEKEKRYGLGLGYTF